MEKASANIGLSKERELTLDEELEFLIALREEGLKE